MKQYKSYFHTFDFYRFCAFFMVFLCHIPFEKGSIGSFFSRSGGSGVFFFFTLSGFLITYLLLKEKEEQGQIHLKNFFVRRILRIWPLYYAMVLFAFLSPYLLNLLGLSSSQEGYEPNWLLNLLFLDNYKSMITRSFPNVSPLGVMWSLCIEEHFYLIWGLAFRFLPLRWYRSFIIGSIVLSLVTLGIYAVCDLSPGDVFSNLVYFGSGAYLSYTYFHNGISSSWSKMSLPFKYLLAIFLFLAIFGINMLQYPVWCSYLVIPLVLAAIFTTLITLTLSQSVPLKIPDNNLLTRLGVYTYGLYLFHTIVINLWLKLFAMAGISNKGLLMMASLLTTIVIAIGSYYFFEKPFLKLKKYFR